MKPHTKSAQLCAIEVFFSKLSRFVFFWTWKARDSTTKKTLPHILLTSKKERPTNLDAQVTNVADRRRWRKETVEAEIRKVTTTRGNVDD